MLVASNLGNLIYEIDKQYDESCQELELYMDIPEVKEFLIRRKYDLLKFKKITAGYNLSIDIVTLHNELKKKYSNKSKYYGGICLKGAKYFIVTEKVKKAVIDKIEKEIAYVLLMEKEEILNFDKDYCIPDELDNKTWNKLYE